MYNIIHSIVILFTSLALGCGIHASIKSGLDVRGILFITFTPGFAFSVYNLGVEVTLIALIILILILSLIEK